MITSLAPINLLSFGPQSESWGTGLVSAPSISKEHHEPELPFPGNVLLTLFLLTPREAPQEAAG